MSDQEDPMRTTVKSVHPWMALSEQEPVKPSSRRRACWAIAATWAATHVLLFWSLDLGPTITSTDMISHVSLGLPFPFLYQDDSWFYGYRLYHFRAHFVSPYENPTHMIWPNYFLDLALVGGPFFWSHV